MTLAPPAAAPNEQAPLELATAAGRPIDEVLEQLGTVRTGGKPTGPCPARL